jgi:hypothetical protein
VGVKMNIHLLIPTSIYFVGVFTIPMETIKSPIHFLLLSGVVPLMKETLQEIPKGSNLFGLKYNEQIVIVIV